MEYDCGDSCHFDFEPNGFRFGSKSKGKLPKRSYPIQCERKWKYTFLNVSQNVEKHKVNAPALNNESIIEKILE